MNKNEHLNQGFKHFTNIEYDKAIECFKEAINLDPNFDTTYNALAEAYNKSDRLDDAIEAAKKMVEISPNDPFSHTALSRLYVQKGLIDDAEREMAISHQLAQQQ